MKNETDGLVYIFSADIPSYRSAIKPGRSISRPAREGECVPDLVIAVDEQDRELSRLTRSCDRATWTITEMTNPSPSIWPSVSPTPTSTWTRSSSP